MKTKEIPHGEVGHYCHGGCAGYAKGGAVEQPMDQDARVKKELGIAPHNSIDSVVSLIPGLGLMSQLGKNSELSDALNNPELLAGKAGPGWNLGTNNRRNSTSFDHAADVMKMSKGGAVEPKDETQPVEIPEDVKEWIDKAHRARAESRPDENWRVKPMNPTISEVPYKRDPEKMKEGDATPHFDAGSQGLVGDDPQVDPQFDVDAGASDTVKMNGQMPPPPDPVIDNPDKAPTDEGPGPNDPEEAPASPAVPANVPRETMPAQPGLTDQDFMDRANKTLGFNPEQSAAFMKMLGDRQKSSQIGAGIAGIGDAIASGGTLGKVNPGALNKSEEIANNATTQGLEGMKTIRGNQAQAQELADKLEARDPNSPLSKWAQKAYGDVGKKIGLNLGNASAALIGDVTGKGVDALNTQYQNQLKMMGLDLQKKQVEATIGNQKAERDIAKEGHKLEASKALADQGILKKAANIFSPGQKTLENVATGGAETAGPVKVDSQAAYDALPSGTHYVDSFGTEKVKK